jgi:hypothetical protein
MNVHEADIKTCSHEEASVRARNGRSQRFKPHARRSKAPMQLRLTACLHLSILTHLHPLHRRHTKALLWSRESLLEVNMPCG